MSSTYHKAIGPDVDGYAVVEVTDAPEYKVIATCNVEANALKIASALNETEEE